MEPYIFLKNVCQTEKTGIHLAIFVCMAESIYSTPKFQMNLKKKLLRHYLSPDFHNKTRNLNACFVMASFTVNGDRTINNRGVDNFIAGGQVHHQINPAAQPT